ncbi:membrane protein [soil metagenome]
MMMVTYAAIIFLFFLPSEFVFSDQRIPLQILGLLATSTIAIPVVTILILWKLGNVKSIRIEEQKERNWPLLLAAIIYLGAFYIVQNKVVPLLIQLFILGAIVGILFSLIVNLKWKISLHMIGAGGLCGGVVAAMILQQSGNPLLLAILFLMTGILGTARLFLNAHSPSQIFSGFIAGFTIEFLLLFLMLR